MPAALLTILTCGGGSNGNFARIAPADIERIAVGKFYARSRSLAHAAFQDCRPYGIQGRLADVLVVGFPCGAVLAELQMQQQPAIAEEGATDARAKRYHAFQSVALDHAQALHGGIIEHRTGTPKRSASAAISEARPIAGCRGWAR